MVLVALAPGEHVGPEKWYRQSGQLYRSGRVVVGGIRLADEQPAGRRPTKRKRPDGR